jgi:hypothetical protein
MTTDNTQYLSDDEGLILNEDNSQIFFGLVEDVGAENIHLLRHEIHYSRNIQEFNSGNFVERMVNLWPAYPTGTSQNYHMYIYAMQEYNRKLDGFGGQIIEPVDAGFRPIDFAAFFGGSPTPGLDDYLLTEAGGFLLQENSFKLVLEQDEIFSYAQPNGSAYFRPNGFSSYNRPEDLFYNQPDGSFYNQPDTFSFYNQP